MVVYIRRLRDRLTALVKLEKNDRNVTLVKITSVIIYTYVEFRHEIS